MASSDLPVMGVTPAYAGQAATGPTVVNMSVGGGSSVSQTQAQPLVGARNVIAGINAARAHDQAQTDAIMSMIGGALKPMIEQEQSRRYFDGAQRVMQGEAAKEIIDQQPWFSSIFGKDATARGATTMGAVATANDMASQFAASMPEDAKLSPSQYRDKMFAKLNEAKTGDPELDTLVQQKFIENADHLITAHAKANYSYVQENMRAAQENIITSASGFMNSIMTQTPDALRTDNRVATLAQQFNEGLVQQPGQSAKSYHDAIMNVGKGMASRAEFHSLNAFMQSDAYKSLPDDDKATLLAARESSEKKHMSEIGVREFGWQYMDLYDKLKNGKLPGKTFQEQEQYAAKMQDQLNAQYRSKYGTSQDFRKESDLIATAEKGLDHIHREQEELSKIRLRAKLEGQNMANALAAKEAMEERKRAQLATDMFNGNGLSAIARIGGMSAEDQRLVQLSAYRMAQAGGPDRVSQMLIDNNQKGRLMNSPMVFKPVSEQWQGTVANAVETGVGYTGETHALMQQVVNMVGKKGGDMAVLDYMGKYGPQVLKAARNIQQGMDSVQAWNAAFKNPVADPRTAMNTKELKSYNADVSSKVADKIKTTYGATLSGVEKQRATSAITAEVHTLVAAGVPLDTAINKATESSNMDVGFSGRMVERGGGGARQGGAGMLGMRQDLFEDASHVAAIAKITSVVNLQDQDAEDFLNRSQIMRLDDTKTTKGDQSLRVPNYVILPPTGAPLYVNGEDIEKANHEIQMGKVKLKGKSDTPLSDAVREAYFASQGHVGGL